MPKRDATPFGAPCWIDLVTPDTDTSRAFYAAMFNWVGEEPDEQFGGYFTFMKDGVPVAGCVPSVLEMEMPNEWSVYLATANARQTLDDVVAHGGEVLIPAMDVADLGTMGVVSDPGGARIGMWEPKQFNGLGVIAETGAPSWFELFTRDYDTIVEFYRTVFGWDTEPMSDTPEFRYTVLKGADGPLAGIMDAKDHLPEGAAAKWSVYFAVDDADAACAKAVELGGTIIRPAEDTPYGRLAVVLDPNGAQFNLMGPNVEMPTE